MHVLRLARLFLPLIALWNHNRARGNRLEETAIKNYSDEGTIEYSPRFWEFVSAYFELHSTVSIVVDSSAWEANYRSQDIIRRFQEETKKSVIVTECGSHHGSDYHESRRIDYMFVTGEVGMCASFYKNRMSEEARVMILWHVDCTTVDDFPEIFSKFADSYAIYQMIVVDSYEKCVLTYSPSERKVLKYDVSEKDRLMEFIRSKHKHFKGLPLDVSIFPNEPMAIQKSDSKEFIGPDGLILDTLAKAMNFTPVFHEVKDGYTYGGVLENGTVTGSLGQVVRREVVFSSNMRFVDMDSTKLDLEYTTPFWKDSLCFVVPKAARRQSWLYMYNVFNAGTSIAITFVFVIVMIVWIAILKWNRMLKIRSILIASVCADVIVLAIGGAVQRRLSAPAERVLIMSCFFLTMILTNCFQGTLIERFDAVAYHPEIDTLADVDQSGLPVETENPLFVELLKRSDDPVVESLVRKIVVVQKNGTRPRGLEMNRDTEVSSKNCTKRRAFLTRYIRAKYKLRLKSVDKDGCPPLYIVKEVPKSFNMAYIMPKRFPLLPDINKYISRIFEAGLIEKWYTDAKIQPGVLLKHLRMSALERNPKPFKIQDLRLPIYILITGMTISCITFLCEIYWYRRCHPGAARPNARVVGHLGFTGRFVPGGGLPASKKPRGLYVPGNDGED